MIDSHIHLDADQYADADQLIKRAGAAGVSAVVAPGAGPVSNARVIELARRFPGSVYAGCGFHPERPSLTDLDLVETDGPWPYQGPFAGRPTGPAMVAEAIAAIAELERERESPQTVRAATVANARRLSGIGPGQP